MKPDIYKDIHTLKEKDSQKLNILKNLMMK